LFANPKIGKLAREKSTHLYTKIIQPNWTHWANYQRHKNWQKKSHIVRKIQFPIQLATTRTIHWSQWLLLNELAFDPTNVRKHGLSYIAFSRIWTKKDYTY
jgi:hypothetical protein